MEKTGIVIKAYDKTATVQVVRHGSCGENCVMCNGGCTAARQTVRANNEMGACIGETVKIEMSDKNVLFAAFFVYIIPIFVLIGGYVIFGAGGAAAGFIIYFSILKILDKKLSKRYTANITKIWGRKY